MIVNNSDVIVIAEIGSVHDGSFGNAQKLIELAAECGADSIKFQTHIPEAETLQDAPMPPYFKGEPRFEYFKRTGFSKEQWLQLKDKCKAEKIEFLSSPFSNEAVELLEAIEIEAYNIPSGEVTNLPMLEKIAETGKPIYLSSGMSSWQELDDAVNLILKYNCDLIVMQCTSEYPCSYKDVGINIMLEMKDRYRLPVGLSDHTLTPYASFLAVSLGAAVIEKHLTFSRLMYGSDAKHSLEPEEFRSLVEGIRAIEKMRSSSVDKDALAVKLSGMKDIFQKSIVTTQDIKAGEVITLEKIAFKKPGTGIPPKEVNLVLGKKAKRDISRDSLFTFDDLD